MESDKRFAEYVFITDVYRFHPLVKPIQNIYLKLNSKCTFNPVDVVQLFPCEQFYINFNSSVVG